MDRNPYEAPEAGTLASTVSAVARGDGKSLVVTSGVVLPPFCVKTGTAVSPEDVQLRRLTWCPPLVGLLILLSGPLMVLVYFLVRKRCVITFGLSPAIRKRFRWWRICKWVVAALLFCALALSPAFESPAVTPVILILFLVAVASLFLGNTPLSIAKHSKGEFWISGCSQAFLSRIAPGESHDGEPGVGAAPG